MDIGPAVKEYDVPDRKETVPDYIPAETPAAVPEHDDAPVPA